MKKNFKGKIISIIIGIIIVLYVVLSGDFLSDVKDLTANASNVNDKADKLVVTGNLSVYFIDVGQADSILVRTGDDNMLIDAGNNEDGPLIVSYLKELGVEKIDYLVGTHPHEDHIGGMDDVIKSFNVETYLMPDVLSTTKTFEDVLDALYSKNLSYEVPEEKKIYNLGDASIEVIYVGEEGGDLNDASIVLRLTYGGNSFLFTGDATSKVEKQILNKDIKSDVLKVAHHGSNYSTTSEFLDKVNPEYAVISVGKNNSYDHPSLTTLEKLNKRGIKTYRTDEDGTIIFTSDGSNITVQTEKTNTNG